MSFHEHNSRGRETAMVGWLVGLASSGKFVKAPLLDSIHEDNDGDSDKSGVL